MQSQSTFEFASGPVDGFRFEPTLAAARARLAAARPETYACTRNHLAGAVTGLSPYLTHGLLSLPEVMQGLLARGPLPVQHKLVQELGWRAWFQHLWAQHGDGILAPLHPGPLPASAYAPHRPDALPDDVAEGRTGIPVIDCAVRQLHATGWLHNHARLWLASALVHGRKLHWRIGADWMLARLLDGDLASNHLSWQWVAGTASHRPYLFDAANVARFAPPAWHSPGSPLDADPARLAHHATSPNRWPPGPPGLPGDPGPMPSAAPPPALGATTPDPAWVDGSDVWLVHPWQLGELPADLVPETQVVAVLVADWHRAWPWTPARWAFVGARLQALAPRRWHGSADAIGAALAGARRVRTVGNPHLDPWLRRWADVLPPPRLFPPVARVCRSFSQWWAASTHGMSSAEELLR